MSKKGDVGIGTLIIFISFLMIVAIAAGVLIQTSSSLGQRTRTTAESAHKQLSTSLNVVDVILVKNNLDEYRYLETTIKLAPGGESIRMADLVMMMETYNSMASVTYRGTNNTFDESPTGFLTYSDQEIGELGIHRGDLVAGGSVGPNFNAITNFDYDLDGVVDTVRLCCGGCGGGYDNTNYIAINITGDRLYYVQLTQAGSPVPNVCLNNYVFDNNQTPVGDYGYVDVLGGPAGGGTISQSYFTFWLARNNLTDNLDVDSSKNDYMYVNSTHALFYWTNGDTDEVSLGADLSSGSVTLDVDTDIGSPAKGRLFISGTTSRANYIDDSVTFTVLPVSYSGYYAAKYIENATNSRAGVILPGDLIKIYTKLPETVAGGEKIILTLIPMHGPAKAQPLTVPEIMHDSAIIIFP